MYAITSSVRAVLCLLPPRFDSIVGLANQASTMLDTVLYGRLSLAAIAVIGKLSNYNFE